MTCHIAGSGSGSDAVVADWSEVENRILRTALYFHCSRCREIWAVPGRDCGRGIGAEEEVQSRICPVVEGGHDADDRIHLVLGHRFCFRHKRFLEAGHRL